MVFLSRGIHTYMFIYTYRKPQRIDSASLTDTVALPCKQDIGALERYVDETMVVLIFLSRGYFLSRNCLREVRATMERNKPVVLVLETDPAKGGFTLDAARAECPEDLRDFVFGPAGSERPVITWHRITIFQLCSLKEIARTMLIHTPLYNDTPAMQVYLDKDLSVQRLAFERPVLAYASPNNPGCYEAAQELSNHFRASELFVVDIAPAGMLTDKPADTALVLRGGPTSDLHVDTVRINTASGGSGEQGKGSFSETATGASTVAVSGSSAWRARLSAVGKRSIERLRRLVGRGRPALDGCAARKLVFVLYLNRETFVDKAGAALALEVQQALDRDVDIVMLHENEERKGGCEFGHLFKSTPKELVSAGLYGPIALAMYAMPHRVVSLALAAQALGATASARKARGSGPSRNDSRVTATSQSLAEEGFNPRLKGRRLKTGRASRFSRPSGGDAKSDSEVAKKRHSGDIPGVVFLPRMHRPPPGREPAAQLPADPQPHEQPAPPGEGGEEIGLGLIARL